MGGLGLLRPWTCGERKLPLWTNRGIGDPLAKIRVTHFESASAVGAVYEDVNKLILENAEKNTP